MDQKTISQQIREIDKQIKQIRADNPKLKKIESAKINFDRLLKKYGPDYPESKTFEKKGHKTIIDQYLTLKKAKAEIEALTEKRDSLYKEKKEHKEKTALSKTEQAEQDKLSLKAVEKDAIATINLKIQFLLRDNPKMGKWPKYKQRFQALIEKHGTDYKLENCKPEDKEFLSWFFPLKEVREKIKELKEKKDKFKALAGAVTIQQTASKPLVQKVNLKGNLRMPKISHESRQSLWGTKLDRSKGREFFKDSVRSGQWAKRR